MIPTHAYRFPNSDFREQKQICPVPINVENFAGNGRIVSHSNMTPTITVYRLVAISIGSTTGITSQIWKQEQFPLSFVPPATSNIPNGHN